MKRALLALAALVAWTSLGGKAEADPKGMKVLKMYEACFVMFKDQIIKEKFVIKEPGGDKVIKFTLYNKGDKRLIKFTYPGDVKGQMVLMRGKNSMYIYLPAYKRVRRIAGHVRNQGFMGSDFTLDDMAIGKWSPEYDPTLVKEDARYWYLVLKAKPGRKLAYPKLKMRILKSNHEADRIEYYSGSGRKLRTAEFLNWTCHRPGNRYCAPSRIVMTDHRRGNHKTVLVEENVRYDVGIPNRKFTLRYLMRGS